MTRDGLVSAESVRYPGFAWAFTSTHDWDSPGGPFHWARYSAADAAGTAEREHGFASSRGEAERQARGGTWVKRDKAEGLIVTKLRFEDGFWRARVSAQGTTLDVDCRYGSWQADVPNGVRGHRDRREVLPGVAAVLSRKVDRAEHRRAA